MTQSCVHKGLPKFVCMYNDCSNRLVCFGCFKEHSHKKIQMLSLQQLTKQVYCNIINPWQQLRTRIQGFFDQLMEGVLKSVEIQKQQMLKQFGTLNQINKAIDQHRASLIALFINKQYDRLSLKDFQTLESLLSSPPFSPCNSTHWLAHSHFLRDQISFYIHACVQKTVFGSVKKDCSQLIVRCANESCSWQHKKSKVDAISLCLQEQVQLKAISQPQIIEWPLSRQVNLNLKITCQEQQLFTHSLRLSKERFCFLPAGLKLVPGKQYDFALQNVGEEFVSKSYKNGQQKVKSVKFKKSSADSNGTSLLNGQFRAFLIKKC